MANRDCYWTGAESTDVIAPGNWADLAGTPLTTGHYPGEYTGSPTEPTYDDKVYLLGARCGAGAHVMSTCTFGAAPFRNWTRGVEMDLAYSTNHAGANVNVAEIALGGDVTVYGSGGILPSTNAPHGPTNVYLHGTSGISDTGGSGVFHNIYFYDGAHVLTTLAGVGGATWHLCDVGTSFSFDSWANAVGLAMQVDYTAQDGVQPAVSDVRASAPPFGVAGHTKQGMFTAATAEEVAAAILETPANKLATDASGRAYADVRSILGTALTETAGYIAAAFKKFFDVQTPVLTTASEYDEHRGRANVGYDGSTLTVNAWLEHRGEVVVEPTSCEVTVYDDAGTEEFALDEDTADAQGVFRLTKASPGLAAGKSYYTKVQIEAEGQTFVTVEGISTL